MKTQIKVLKALATLSVFYFGNLVAARELPASKQSRSMDVARQIINKTGPSVGGALLSFTSEYKELNIATGKKWCAATRRWLSTGSDGTNQVIRNSHIQGSFSLIATLGGEVPPLGRVSRTSSEPGGRAAAGIAGPGGEDEQMVEFGLGDIVDSVAAELPEEFEPLLVLGIWPENARTVFDDPVILLLSKSDVKNIADAGPLLRREAFKQIDQKTAEGLLDSKNPWKVFVGLNRLEDLKELSSSDFIRACRAVPTVDIRQCLDDLFSVAPENEKVKGTLQKELADFFKKSSPERQALLLKNLNGIFAEKWPYISTLVDLPHLQNAAEKYRSELSGQADRREVFYQLDTFIKLRPK